VLYWGGIRVIELLTGLAAVFCANLSILPKFAALVNVYSPNLSEKITNKRQQRKMSKYLNDSKSRREALSF
jgi:hypothetical protein